MEICLDWDKNFPFPPRKFFGGTIPTDAKKSTKQLRMFCLTHLFLSISTFYVTQCICYIPYPQWFSCVRFCLRKKYLETFYNSVEAGALRECYTTPEIVQQCFFHSMRFVYLFVDELSAKDNNSEIPLNILAAFVACHELSSIFSLCFISFPTVKYDEDIKRMKNSRRWHQHQNKIWDFVEHFWAYFAYSLSLPLQNDMKLQMYRNAFHFICLASADCLILWREYCCCCCYTATADARVHIQSDSNSRTENKIPVKYLEFYSFACHVIEIFTCFFRRFFFRRDKHFDTAWQTWWWWNEKTTAETKMKRKKNITSSSFVEFLSK